MKRIGLLTLAFLLAPVAVFAQDAPPPGPPPAAGAPGPQRFAEMRQDRQQIEQLHAQARTQMLAALSPAHRAALANIVGQLAVSPNPDPRAAAQQLDALLSTGEKQSILNIETQAHAQMRTLMQAARARMEASLTPDQRAQMDSRATQRQDRPHEANRQPDAGRALLMTAIHAGPPEGMHPGRE
jgi:Spy/CpxP family protein refolding chaperone